MCNLIFTLCYSRSAALQQSTLDYMCGKFKAAVSQKSLFTTVSPTKQHLWASLAFPTRLGDTLRSPKLFCWQRRPRVETHLRSGWAWDIQLGFVSRQKMCSRLQARYGHAFSSPEEHVCGPTAQINRLCLIYITDKLCGFLPTAKMRRASQ